jgi:hypothetical protein
VRGKERTDIELESVERKRGRVGGGEPLPEFGTPSRSLIRFPREGRESVSDDVLSVVLRRLVAFLVGLSADELVVLVRLTVEHRRSLSEALPDEVGGGDGVGRVRGEVAGHGEESGVGSGFLGVEAINLGRILERLDQFPNRRGDELFEALDFVDGVATADLVLLAETLDVVLLEAPGAVLVVTTHVRVFLLAETAVLTASDPFVETLEEGDDATNSVGVAKGDGFRAVLLLALVTGEETVNPSGLEVGERTTVGRRLAPGVDLAVGLVDDRVLRLGAFDAGDASPGLVGDVGAVGNLPRKGTLVETSRVGDSTESPEELELAATTVPHRFLEGFRRIVAETDLRFFGRVGGVLRTVVNLGLDDGGDAFLDAVEGNKGDAVVLANLVVVEEASHRDNDVAGGGGPFAGD